MNVVVTKCVMCYLACIRISACVCLCIGVHVCVYVYFKFILFLLQSPSVSNTVQYLRAYIYYNYSTSHMYNVICTGLIHSDDVEVHPVAVIC